MKCLILFSGKNNKNIIFFFFVFFLFFLSSAELDHRVVKVKEEQIHSLHKHGASF